MDPERGSTGSFDRPQTAQPKRETKVSYFSRLCGDAAGGLAPRGKARTQSSPVKQDGAEVSDSSGEQVLVDEGLLRAWAFDLARLHEAAASRAAEYRAARPFPYVAFDDLFPDALLDALAQDFPPPDDVRWHRHDDHRQRKLQWGDPASMPVSISQFIGLLQSAPFIEFLECVTGITGLVGDPHCFHGGLHLVEPGGYLKIHGDQSLQEQLLLYRRVNVIVYLNKGWDPAWGGALELWNSDMSACEVTVEPRFNRTMVFDVQAGSHHGHPEPLASPPGTVRRSIALYYYTSAENPSTPQLNYHGAQLRARPGERLEPTRRKDWRALAVDVCPPVLTRALRRARGHGISSRW